MGFRRNTAVGIAFLAILPVTLIADGPAQPTLEQALKARPEELGQGYLVVDYNLALLGISGGGATLHTMIDGEAVTIDSANAKVWTDGLQKRLETYGAAIRERGFQQLAGEYTIEKGQEEIYAPSKQVTIEQDSFVVHLIVHIDSDSLRVADGVSVESKLVFIDRLDPSRFLVGKVDKGKIKLKDSSGHEIRLKAP